MPALYSYSPVWPFADAFADDLAARAQHKRRMQKRARPEDEPAPFAPLVDIYDLESAYVIEASLPGAAASAISVDYDSKIATLIIAGEIKRTTVAGVHGEPASKALKVGERQIGKFERRVKLPDGVKIQQDRMTAKYSNGVLEIALSKAPEPQRKSIVVQAEDDVPANAKTATDEQPAAASAPEQAAARPGSVSLEDVAQESDSASVKSFDSEMSS
ncbi:HSP20-like chaperone [Lipomyces tetrasporus]|uniref:HSP20-like chaperone n=1 Tax=Lipomyces tetrasporus TaxID=54092 RepID=A0AAD7QTU3_9ASCO|nr:HSP20-like chaperone [Lipomyces tetrasporus]KAJ8101389.1 HSP20-like chaperone [Lipomyces tetrasporus]